jgi:hypothetical protein
MTPTFTRTLRLKVRPESYGWLNAAALEVNGVFNYCNEASLLAATRTDLKRKWLSGCVGGSVVVRDAPSAGCR